MTKSLGLVIALGVAMLATPAPAGSQPVDRVARIGVAMTTPALKDAFIAGLRDAGFVDGENAVIVHRTLADTAIKEILAQSVDVIFAASPSTIRAAKQATSTIPIVGVDLESDPVASGFVKTLARPGGNVTGYFLDLPELGGKLIQLLREIVPGLSKVGIVWLADHGQSQFAATEEAARAAGIRLVSLPIHSAEDLRRAFERARRERVGGVVILSGPLLMFQRAMIAELAEQHRLPSVSLFTVYPDVGGLLGYGPNFPDIMRRAAGYVARVLRGAKPADLPVQRPEKFELVVNLKTATALGVTVPPLLLLRADRVIQ